MPLPTPLEMDHVCYINVHVPFATRCDKRGASQVCHVARTLQVRAVEQIGTCQLEMSHARLNTHAAFLTKVSKACLHSSA